MGGWFNRTNRLTDRREANNCPCLSTHLPRKVGPWDVLYVPPFWWHTVETLSPSASLSTLSRYHLLYNRMRGLYRMH